MNNVVRFWSAVESGLVVRCPHRPTASGDWRETQTCQNGNYDLCLAGNRSDCGVLCPSDSCDIDDGVRPMPANIDDPNTLPRWMRD